MRLFLALRCFFAVLFARPLPPRALPAPEEPPAARQAREALAADLAAAKGQAARLEAELAAKAKALSEAEGRAKGAAKLQGELDGLRAQHQQLEQQLEAVRAAGRATEEELRGKLKDARDAGALALLGWLQREGRLLDFLREEIDGFDDAQVGGAVRAIHKGCKRVVEQALALEPVLAGGEGERVQVPAGFDPVAIQLTGRVKGDPPFQGTLVHHGWRTSRVAVPVPEAVDPRVLAPAEVEL